MRFLLLFLLFPTILLAQNSDDEALRRKHSYFYMAAQRAKAQERYAEMIEMLDHCRDLIPDDPATMFELGQVAFPLGQDSVGLQLIEQAVNADPANPWYLERLASIYLSQNKLEQALAVIEKMAALQTKRIDVLSQLFMLYKQMGRTEDAIHALDRIQVLQGNSLRIAEQKYRLYCDMEQQEQAYEQIRVVCREFPYDVNGYTVLSMHFMENEQLDSAEVYLEKAARIDPNDGSLQMLRIQRLQLQGDTLAYEHKRDSLVMDERVDRQLRLNVMRDIALVALQDTTKRAHAEQLFQHQLDKELPDVTFLQLYKYYDEYLHADIKDYFNLPLMERILQLDPSDLQTQSERVQHYINQNDAAGLQRVCSEALIHFPTEVRFHYFLALAYLQDDRKQDALETLKAGIREADETTAPEMVGTLYCLVGDLLHEMGRERESFAAYDSCLVYSPNEASCLNNYAYYLSLKGADLERAEQMSYRAVRLQPDSKTYIDTYAWVLFVQEDYTTARIYMDKVVNPELDDQTLLSDPDVNAVLLEHAGDIYANCDDIDTALRLWQLAKQRDSISPVLKKKLKKKKYFKK